MKCKFFVLLLAILVFLSACSAKTEFSSPHRFYYCRATYEYGGKNGIITSECKTPPPGTTSTSLLEDYLSGPEDKQLFSPFPEGTKLEFLSVFEGKAEVTLSKEFAQLTNAELTLACACLTLTVSQITSCSTVEIIASGTLLNDQSSITMDASSLVLSDTITVETDR